MHKVLLLFCALFLLTALQPALAGPGGPFSSSSGQPSIHRPNYKIYPGFRKGFRRHRLHWLFRSRRKKKASSGTIKAPVRNSRRHTTM